MATNVQRYAKRYEELISAGKSHEDAHNQAARESESTTNKEPKNKKRMGLMTFLTGAKSPIPEAKRKILEQAGKDIQELQKMKTARTESVQRATGVESDIEKAARERAKKARKNLTLLTGKK